MRPTAPLRLGVLGAARIAPAAVIEPALRSSRVRVVAVAARDAVRAQRFALEHGALRVEPGYDALVDSPDVDAVYIALPAALHAHWTVRALHAGKHVLCEKPFASNAREAEQMVAAAIAADRVLLEAFHYRFHPLADRIRAIVTSGEIGRVVAIDGLFTVAIRPGDIRHDLALGGGGLMDLGCYPVHWARLVAGTEPTVASAEAILGAPGIDMSMTAELAFTDRDGGAGASARIHCSMAPGVERRATLHVRGDRGELMVENPLAPHTGHRLDIHGPDGPRTENVAGRTTYDHQLEAFAAAVLDGGPRITGGADSIANMRVIDAIYRAAGMSPRGEGSAALQ
jgi:predicted dehydrogenase